MREFFTGGKDVQEARQKITELEARGKLSARQLRNLEAAKKVTRRHALKLGADAALVGAAFAAAGGFLVSRGKDRENYPIDTLPTIIPTPEPSSLLPEIPETIIDLPTRQPHARPEAEVPLPLDKKYLEKLFLDLNQPSGDYYRRIRSLRNNIALVQRSEDRGAGTAIKICESGYYLTAAHVLSDKNKEGPRETLINGPAVVYNPSDGLVLSISEILADHDYDLALFYAPSGKQRQRIEGIQINQSPLQHEQKLWQLGLMVWETQGIFSARIHYLFGSVDLAPPATTSKAKNLIKVKGMIPFGGSSGGPIVDSNGVIVAIESSYYVDFGDKEYVENKRENYVGSEVAPITILNSLLEKPVHRLPKGEG